ncbi:hypothetical protein CVV38_00940 [Candidatus Peregrinibacteria bacterium HGW-Peregrinibacteria-1]|jgi:ribonuclease Y|nr:MAG: hypothetical protein CVV38_00940 [Candidatus Peregrinibacteria bacterium HGW-Peregrinibacteria-1]
MQNILFIIIGLIIGGVLPRILMKGIRTVDIEKKRKEAAEIVKSSQLEAKEIIEKTKSQVNNYEQSSVEESKNTERRLSKMEENLKNKGENIEKRSAKLEEQENRIKKEIQDIEEIKNRVKEFEGEVLNKLSSKTGQKIEELKSQILIKNEKELEIDMNEKLIRIEEQVKEDATKKARKILVTIIQRLCSPTSVERRAVHVKVDRDSSKGKIVGKDGSNVIYIEEKLGVSIVFNDLPMTISVTCFNLVQRRIAQKTIAILVKEHGEINFEIIDRAIEAAEKEVNEELYGIGKKAADKMKLEQDDPEFLKTVGRLKYRTSYGQNIMKHSMEVGWIASMIGTEIGLDENTCRVAGFLHDLGKAIDQDPNEKDTHDYLSKEIMEKHGFSWEEVHAAWTHHDAIPQETPEAIIVKAADAVSASRPGARQESIFSYAERIEAIQEIVSSFEGVKKAYTMSAGREVRAYVEPKKVTDQQIQSVAKKMATTIEDELAYPGKVRVNVIRRLESRQIARGKKKKS